MFDISDFPLDAASGNHSCMSSNKIDFGEQTSHHGTRIWKLECKNNQDKGKIEGWPGGSAVKIYKSKWVVDGTVDREDSQVTKWQVGDPVPRGVSAKLDRSEGIASGFIPIHSITSLVLSSPLSLLICAYAYKYIWKNL